MKLARSGLITHRKQKARCVFKPASPWNINGVEYLAVRYVRDRVWYLGPVSYSDEATNKDFGPYSNLRVALAAIVLLSS